MVKEMKYIFNNPDVSWFTRWNTITKDVLEIGKAECLHFNDMKNGKQLYKHVYGGFIVILAVHPSLISLGAAYHLLHDSRQQYDRKILLLRLEVCMHARIPVFISMRYTSI